MSVTIPTQAGCTGSFCSPGGSNTLSSDEDVAGKVAQNSPGEACFDARCRLDNTGSSVEIAWENIFIFSSFSRHCCLRMTSQGWVVMKMKAQVDDGAAILWL